MSRIYGAYGDGIHDDTAAIQAALTAMVNQSVSNSWLVYIPAGTYLISSTLTTDINNGMYGGGIIGNGSATILKWTGATGGKMFQCGGMPLGWFEGITWDGQGVAADGIYDYITNGYFPSGLRHQNEAFLNFTGAGIYAGDCSTAFSEQQIRNCLFYNCGTGISVYNFNYYNWYVEQCEFESCGTGMYWGYWTSAYVSDCHFQNSTSDDILNNTALYSLSIRRCTSYGSHDFLTGNSPITIDNCVVDSWTNTGYAVSFSGTNDLIYDVRFLNPPSGASPPILASNNIGLTMSNCQLNGSVNNVIANPTQPLLIPPGAGAVGCTLVNAQETFLKSTWPVPSVVKDLVTDFGAVRNTDCTTALQNGVAPCRRWATAPCCISRQGVMG